MIHLTKAQLIKLGTKLPSKTKRIIAQNCNAKYGYVVLVLSGEITNSYKSLLVLEQAIEFAKEIDLKLEKMRGYLKAN